MTSKALTQILKTIQIRPVTSMKFVFDPYTPQVRSIRESVYLLNLERIRDTNLDCRSKVEVKCDQSEPTFTANFVDGETYIFKTKNLTTEDIVTKLHYLCIEKDTKKEEVENYSMTTKKTKLKGGKK